MLLELEERVRVKGVTVGGMSTGTLVKFYV